MEVGLDPGNIVLDEEPAPPPQKGTQQPPLFGPLCSGTVAHLSNIAELLYCLMFEQINLMMMTMMMFCCCCNLKGKRRRVVVYDYPVKALLLPEDIGKLANMVFQIELLFNGINCSMM